MTSFERHSRLVLGIFWALAAAFLLVLICWAGLMWRLLPGVLGRIGPTAFPLLLLVIIVLGVLLLLLLIRRRAEWTDVWLKRSLILTGAASTAVGIGVIFHNLLDALAELTADWPIISSSANALAVVFFFVGILVRFK